MYIYSWYIFISKIDILTSTPINSCIYLTKSNYISDYETKNWNNQCIFMQYTYSCFFKIILTVLLKRIYAIVQLL